MEIRIEKGFIRDFDGIWHNVNNVLRLYVKAEKKKNKWYSQVVGDFKDGLYGTYGTRVVIELTKRVPGKNAAQDELDVAFGFKQDSGTWLGGKRIR